MITLLLGRGEILHRIVAGVPAPREGRAIDLRLRECRAWEEHDRKQDEKGAHSFLEVTKLKANWMRHQLSPCSRIRQLATGGAHLVHQYLQNERSQRESGLVRRL
jgi:hypothetical protein